MSKQRSLEPSTSQQASVSRESSTSQQASVSWESSTNQQASASRESSTGQQASVSWGSSTGHQASVSWGSRIGHHACTSRGSGTRFQFRVSWEPIARQRGIVRKRRLSRQVHVPRPGSPDEVCAICLDTVTDKTLTDVCTHIFCFTCISVWTEVQPFCPLCKRKFKYIRYELSKDNYEDHNIMLKRYKCIRMGPGGVPLRGYAAIQPRRIVSAVRADNRTGVYHLNAWVLPFRNMKGIKSSPYYYRANPWALKRLQPWLMREVSAILRGCLRWRMPSTDYVTRRVMYLLTYYNIRSLKFRTAIANSLTLDYVDHFIHELYSFATTALCMGAYDTIAPYDSMARPAFPEYLRPLDEAVALLTGAPVVPPEDEEVWILDDDDDVEFLGVFPLNREDIQPRPRRRNQPIVIEIHDSSDEEVVPRLVASPETITLSSSDSEGENEVAPEASRNQPVNLSVRNADNSGSSSGNRSRSSTDSRGRSNSNLSRPNINDLKSAGSSGNKCQSRGVVPKVTSSGSSRSYTYDLRSSSSTCLNGSRCEAPLCVLKPIFEEMSRRLLTPSTRSPPKQGKKRKKAQKKTAGRPKRALNNKKKPKESESSSDESSDMACCSDHAGD